MTTHLVNQINLPGSIIRQFEFQNEQNKIINNKKYCFNCMELVYDTDQMNASICINDEIVNIVMYEEVNDKKVLKSLLETQKLNIINECDNYVYDLNYES